MKCVIRHTTGVSIERAPGKTTVDYPTLLAAKVRPITVPISAATTTESETGYMSVVPPTETGLRVGTRITSFASDLDASDLGHVVEFTVGELSTSGALEKIQAGPFEDMIRVTVDGTDFVMPAGKPVAVVIARRIVERPSYYTVR